MDIQTKHHDGIRRLVYAAVCLALAFVLPFLTGQIPQIGSMLSPMHLPVLLCGFLCGWPYGLAVGFAAPLLRSLILGMPPMMPTAAAMAFELAAYGALSGLFCRVFPKKTGYLYLSLLLAMLGGRAVWGLAMWLIMGLSGGAFTLAAFWTGAFVRALPGIAVQIVLVPLIVLALRRAGLIPGEPRADA